MFRKKSFMYIDLNYSNYHQQETTCTFIYIQKAFFCETFLYTQKEKKKSFLRKEYIYIFRPNTESSLEQ